MFSTVAFKGDQQHNCDKFLQMGCQNPLANFSKLRCFILHCIFILQARSTVVVLLSMSRMSKIKHVVARDRERIGILRLLKKVLALFNSRYGLSDL